MENFYRKGFSRIGHREGQTCREPWVHTAGTLSLPSVRDVFWNRQFQPSRVFLNSWVHQICASPFASDFSPQTRVSQGSLQWESVLSVLIASQRKSLCASGFWSQGIQQTRIYPYPHGLGPLRDHGLRPWSQPPSERCKFYGRKGFSVFGTPFLDLVSQTPCPT